MFTYEHNWMPYFPGAELGGAGASSNKNIYFKGRGSGALEWTQMRLYASLLYSFVEIAKTKRQKQNQRSHWDMESPSSDYRLG